MNLPEIVKKSDLIVAGTMQSVRSYTVVLGRLLESEYTVRVTQTIKVTAPEVLKVVANGGKVTFKDGTWAQIKTQTAKYMRPDATFLLFLRENNAFPFDYDMDLPESRDRTLISDRFASP